MPVPTTPNPMGGKLTVEIDGVVIPSFMLGNVSASVSEILRTSERLSGTTTTPTGLLDNPQFDITFFPNTWADMQYFMPDNMDGTSFVMGASTCVVPTDVPVILHYECDADETRDVSLPVCKVSFEDTSDRTQADDLSVMIHIYPQPNPLGTVVYGPMPTS